MLLHHHFPIYSFIKQTFNRRNILHKQATQQYSATCGLQNLWWTPSWTASGVARTMDMFLLLTSRSFIFYTGTLQARQAIAEYMTCPGAPVEAKDVIICSGCSCSLDLCVSVLCSPGSSILVPRPGFPLYTTLAEGFGCTSKYYNLLPEKNWQVDLVHLESLVDDTTVAIVINNPSNPCGSVFPKSHLRAIADIAVKYKIPIIADEIYDNFVFEGEEYHPIASVHPELPVLACGGLTKRFLVPGWRMGWIAVHDRNGAMQEVLGCLRTLSQRIIGSNTIVQGALPDILSKTPQSFFDDTLKQIQVRMSLECFNCRFTKNLKAKKTPQIQQKKTSQPDMLNFLWGFLRF
ncbi:hypothetical protein HAZT_HAZT005343 [Hyalella azteca]|uniref:Aminotransferase class I/classII large domain-containing protein n=1 Tax=Hyalella azteca TaxID=294128 RepID=A0A6A0H7Z0_HYAAZ|nr:hypothetical protein HAZT_HAZT005343 [Hyalella azteca]